MIYRLHGTIQPYAWGGHDYIPQLLRREPSNLPAAETVVWRPPAGAVANPKRTASPCRLMTGCKKT